MDIKWIGFLSFSFVGLTALNRIMEGALISATDVDILNSISLTKKAAVGIWTIPVPNVDAFQGLFHLAKWDYSFFGGNAQYIQFFLYSVTFAFMIGLVFILLGGISYNVLRTR